MATRDWVLLGERHDNPDHHRLQAWLIERLGELGRRPAIAFEMMESDQADIIARHLAEKPGDAAGLGAALSWEKSGWPAWDENYRPIAQAAIERDLPLIAANLTKSQVRDIVRGKAVELPLGPVLAEPVMADLAEEIRAGHCNMLPEAMVAPMANAQRGKDAAMARAMVEGAAKDGAVLIAGAGHTRKDRGVPMHLAALAPGTSSAALAFMEVSADSPTPQDYALALEGAALPFDIIWFTPRLDDIDHCAAHAEQLQKIGRDGK